MREKQQCVVILKWNLLKLTIRLVYKNKTLWEVFNHRRWSNENSINSGNINHLRFFTNRTPTHKKNSFVGVKGYLIPYESTQWIRLLLPSGLVWYRYNITWIFEFDIWFRHIVSVFRLPRTASHKLLLLLSLHPLLVNSDTYISLEALFMEYLIYL